MIRTLALTALLAAGTTVLAACDTGTEPTAVQSADHGGGKGGGAPAKKVTVAIAAKRVAYDAGPLDDGTPHSCVKITVVNHRKKNLAVNPLYFSLVDSKGEKHEVDVTATEDQIPTTTLAPGEKAKGTVCAEKKFVPHIVAMTDELLQEQARAEVG
ncbi:DUF4352 domain-containing protein [Actinomadura atramentaria]|uniref:DUF4352 domain-containing protein n=1 Tax=Actinomadura atramentaria TaxID=1990 RepID=UPI000366EDD3|nr:DUF4352 domain-containing protein [Actinomadura atramentaria]